MFQGLRKCVAGIWTRGGELYKKFKLKYAVPFVLLFLYTVFGASLFYFVERNNDVSRRENYRRNYQYAFEQIMERLVEIKCDPWFTDPDFVRNKTLLAVNWFQNFLNFSTILDEQMGESPWTWWGAMFYSGTLYTTIGYGRPVTSTTMGRLLSCLYAVVGIPLFLVILKEAGVHLSRILRKSWKRWTKTWRKSSNSSKKFPANINPFRKMTLISIAPPSIAGSAANLNVEALGEKRFSTNSKELAPESQQQRPFPIILSFLVLITWILLCAGLFCLWESEWSYFTSVYFFFISVSTIGLGDVIPSQPDFMVFNFLLILIGLALGSMVFNIIQIRIQEVMDNMLQQFMDEFEKIAAATRDRGDQFEVGKFGPSDMTAIAPVLTPPPITPISSIKEWFRSQLYKSRRRKRKLSTFSGSSSSSDEDKPDVTDAMELWASNQSGFKKALLTKLIDQQRIRELEEKVNREINQRSVEVQTENDLSDLFEHLLHREADSQTIVSDSTSFEELSSFVTSRSENPSEMMSFRTALGSLPDIRL